MIGDIVKFTMAAAEDFKYSKTILFLYSTNVDFSILYFYFVISLANECFTFSRMIYIGSVYYTRFRQLFSIYRLHLRAQTVLEWIDFQFFFLWYQPR